MGLAWPGQVPSALWSRGPYQSPWDPRPVRLQLDKVLPTGLDAMALVVFSLSRETAQDWTNEPATSSEGLDVDPMSLLPTLLSGAASPRSRSAFHKSFEDRHRGDDDKGSSGNVDSFFSGDPLASLFNAGR